MNLTFDEEIFDIVTAFNSIYNWPNVKQCLNNVKRVLKPEGRLVIVNDSDGDCQMDKMKERLFKGMHIYTQKELEKILNEAGFVEIKIHRYKPQVRRNSKISKTQKSSKAKEHWLMIIAQKPNE